MSGKDLKIFQRSHKIEKKKNHLSISTLIYHILLRNDFHAPRIILSRIIFKGEALINPGRWFSGKMGINQITLNSLW